MQAFAPIRVAIPLAGERTSEIPCGKFLKYYG